MKLLKLPLSWSALPHGRAVRAILNAAITANWRFGMRRPFCRGVVPAEAGTHGKYVQEHIFLRTWIPAFERMK